MQRESMMEDWEDESKNTQKDTDTSKDGEKIKKHEFYDPMRPPGTDDEFNPSSVDEGF